MLEGKRYCRIENRSNLVPIVPIIPRFTTVTRWLTEEQVFSCLCAGAFVKTVGGTSITKENYHSFFIEEDTKNNVTVQTATSAPVETTDVEDDTVVEEEESQTDPYEGEYENSYANEMTEKVTSYDDESLNTTETEASEDTVVVEDDDTTTTTTTETDSEQEVSTESVSVEDTTSSLG